MNAGELYKMLIRGNVNNVKLENKDGLTLLELIVVKKQLDNFIITINQEKGKTTFHKI